MDTAANGNCTDYRKNRHTGKSLQIDARNQPGSLGFRTWRAFGALLFFLWRRALTRWANICYAGGAARLKGTMPTPGGSFLESCCNNEGHRLKPVLQVAGTFDDSA